MTASASSERALPGVSAVIRTRNESPRLALVLESLARQPLLETIVVDDASDDGTAQVAAEAARHAPVRYIRNPQNIGRSATSNAGARAARGDVLFFVDGDTLAGPGCIERHARAHAAGRNIVARGEPMHLRCTRFLLDPQVASPRPGEEARLLRMPHAERERLKVTREQVAGDFAAIEARAEAGIYPGAGPRKLHDLEVDAFRTAPDCPLLWAAATGSNLSIRRDVFLAAGGFAHDIHLNEHREAALRFTQLGAAMRLVEGAKTYHLTHRTGWRDPLADPQWERVFYARHPLRAVKLLAVMWAGIADSRVVPEGWRIESIAQLAQCAQAWSDEQIDALRAHIPGLAPLPDPACP